MQATHGGESTLKRTRSRATAQSKTLKNMALLIYLARYLCYAYHSIERTVRTSAMMRCMRPPPVGCATVDNQEWSHCAPWDLQSRRNHS